MTECCARDNPRKSVQTTTTIPLPPHRKVNHRRRAYLSARRSTSRLFSSSSSSTFSLISGFLDRLTEARIKLRSKDTAGHFATTICAICATQTLVCDPQQRSRPPLIIVADGIKTLTYSSQVAFLAETVFPLRYTLYYRL